MCDAISFHYFLNFVVEHFPFTETERASSRKGRNVILRPHLQPISFDDPDDCIDFAESGIDTARGNLREF
jgi:hypothetical protein